MERGGGRERKEEMEDVRGRTRGGEGRRRGGRGKGIEDMYGHMRDKRTRMDT